ncbi:C-type lectin domain family 4 member E-like [Engraulis encrasicolus]|uniref:C-type lectin domain family 4 member E-like n=1 Tax=Engraulis encrasicolus TaxID=184585 RepID=UPI002FD59FB1
MNAVLHLTEEKNTCDVEYAAVTFRRNETPNHKRLPRAGLWIAGVLVVLLCVGVGLCLLFLGPSAERCSMAWDIYGGKCYFLSHDKFNWTASRDKCVSMGGHLVIIESREEQMYVKHKLNGTEDDFWIGLTDSEREGQWKWVDNSDLKNITFWHRGQPNNSSGFSNITYVDGEDCAIMRYVKNTELNWFDQYCAQLNKMICEAKSG